MNAVLKSDKLALDSSIDSENFPVGCFAPPLTDDKLEEYELLAETAPEHIRDAMRRLIAPVKLWWGLPESKLRGRSVVVFHRRDPNVPRKETQVEIRPLEQEHKAKIWDATPWGYETEAMEAMFEGIDQVKDRDLRNAAFHLIWYVKELNFGREPMTNEKL